MELLEPGASYSPFEDAVVLLCIDVERLLVERGVILDLVDGLFWVAMVGVVVKKEAVRRVGGGGRRRLARVVRVLLMLLLLGLVLLLGVLLLLLMRGLVEVVEMVILRVFCVREVRRWEREKGRRRTVLGVVSGIEDVINVIHVAQSCDWPRRC